MVVGDSVKLDTNPCIREPPNLCCLNKDGITLFRRDQKESDIHTGDEPNRAFNPTTVSGKIHRSDDMWSVVVSKESSGEGDGKSLIAALDHL
jgi:hypothetical protein